MRVDTGLREGIKALRQNEQLLDLTLKVDKEEFRVHKVVLASVSDYFCSMLCGPESKCNIVELKGVGPEQVSKFINFIYTGDKSGEKEEFACGDIIQVNTELQDGVRALRQNDQLSDLTLGVNSQKFRVHKVILASVSDYFRAMLCGSLKDSVGDSVTLKGISATQVSSLLDFVYTGDDAVIESNPKEMLECGVYLQLPTVIQECTRILSKSLLVRNCLDLLSTFQKFPVDETVQVIKDFIKMNLRKVMDHYKAEDIPLEVVQVALKIWKKSEWEMFNYLNSWFAADYENREQYVDDFLGEVRFKLMTAEEISAVKNTTVFANRKGAWKLLVDEASAYHELPFYQKVLDKSVQNRARNSKSAFVMDIDSYSADHSTSSRGHILCKPKKGSGMQVWKPCPDVKPPPVGKQFWFIIEVNNFLIACSEADHATQHWLIFDPRTLAWHEMARMPRPRDGFAAVYHKKRIYVLGGSVYAGSKRSGRLDEIEEYSFETGMWSSTMKVPIPVSAHAACALKDAIYISGGWTDGGPLNNPRVDCLDLTTKKWESKAPLLLLQYRRTSEHKMFAMKIKMKDVIVLVYRGLWMEYYDPDTNQWSELKYSHVPQPKPNPKIKDRSLKPVKHIFLNSTGEIIAHGNTLYFLSCGGELYHDKDSTEYCLCVKWIIPQEEDKSDISEIRLGDDPLREEKRSDWFGVIWGMMAFPPQSTTKVMKEC